MPSAALMSGRYASIRNCTTVTKVAMITMNAGILTLFGITFLSSEMIRLLIISTAVVARPMPSPFIAEVVTARVGHIPRVRTKVGFSLNNPLASLSIGESDFFLGSLIVLTSPQFRCHLQRAVYCCGHGLRRDRCTADRIDLILLGGTIFRIFDLFNVLILKLRY